MLDQSIQKTLQNLHESDLFRSLTRVNRIAENTLEINGREYVDFASNDYLNLSAHPVLREAAKSAIADFGVGLASSQLITGSHPLVARLETAIANFKGYSKAAIFNSGYTANLGIIQALSALGDVEFFLDRLVHASLIDGVMQNSIKFKRFRHNDAAHARKLIGKSTAKLKIIVVDSVYSMEGDTAPLRELAALKAEFENVALFVDDAHGTGVFGARSRGFCEGHERDIDILMGTFSKALASTGAFVACSENIYNLLVNYSRSLIYTTALPPAVYAVNLAAIQLIENNPSWGSELREKSVHFRQLLEQENIPLIEGQSQIIPILLHSNERAVKFVERLRSRGFWVTPIRTPTVPKGQARVRLTIHRLHSEEQLRSLKSAITEEFPR